MKSLRESSLFNSKRFSERKSVIGSYSSFDRDIYRQQFLTPHAEMEMTIKMFNRNSLAASAVSTMKDFIKGGEIRVRSLDENTRKKAQEYIESLNIDAWLDELIENTIKTGNGYLELEFSSQADDVPIKVYPITDSSRIYINCDEFGKPLPMSKLGMGRGNELSMQKGYAVDEYYIQRIEPQYKIAGASYYTIRYQFGSMYKQAQIYGIPIPMKNIIHIKLGISDIGVYGRSMLASTTNDFQTMEQIERSIAIIAKHKAVPRDILVYGNDQNPATDDELNDFIIYLESLQKDESAIINKPIQRETLSYSGQDINLDYMIQHIKKKLVAGIAPEFAMGLSSDTNRSTAQLSLLSYVLSIYAKRKLFLKPIENRILKPFLAKFGLEDAWLEFGELDFETKTEKSNRIGALWTQNALTLNEMRHQLGFSILEHGDVFFTQWQNTLMQQGMDPSDDMTKGLQQAIKGSPGANTKQPSQSLPNNDDTSQVFTHRPAPNSKPVQKGGRLPHDVHRPKSSAPRLIKKQKSSMEQLMEDIHELESMLK